MMNNACLIGDPSLGKTVSITEGEGLEQPVVNATVRKKLQAKKVRLIQAASFPSTINNKFS